VQTTNLFVELVVIGLGGALWLALATLTVFGYQWIPVEEVTSLPGLIPALAVIYLLGILIDRISDRIFQGRTKAMASRAFPSVQDYERARNLVYTSEALRGLAEYTLSRMRICRGWVLNSLLSVVAANAFIWTALPDQVPRMKVASFATLVLLFIGVAALYSWRQLLSNYYDRVAQQGQLLMNGLGQQPE
jgi:hypothetical protein